MTPVLPAARVKSLALLLFSFTLLSSALSAAPQAQEDQEARLPNRSAAYYHYSLAHLYEQLAMQFVSQEYIPKAFEEYKRAIEADPNSDFLRLELANLYARTNRLDDAVAEIQKVLGRDPNQVEARRLLANIYHSYATGRRGRQTDETLLRKAIEEYEKVVELESGDTDSLLRLASLHREAGDRDKAEAVLKKLLEIAPDSGDALTSLAYLYLEMGNNDAAIEALEKVRASGGGDPSALLLLGGAYERTGKYEEAAAVFEQVVGMGGNNLEARKSLAHNLVLSGSYEKALEHYEQLVQIEPDNVEHYLRLSQIHRQERRFDQARAMIEKAQQLEPDSLELKYNSVLLLESEGKTGEAIQAMKDLLDQTGKERYTEREKQNRAMFLEQLGMLHRSQDNFEEARQAFHSMAELDAGAKPRALAQVVETYRAARNYEQAKAASKEALEQFPDNRSLAVLRANVLAETGDAEQGAKILNRLLQGDPRDREIFLSLAHVYEKGKQFDEALEAIEQARRLSSTDSEKIAVLFTHGSVLERAKRFDEAEEKFREILAMDPGHASALNYLGYMLADLNKSLDEAHEMIQKALDDEPDNGAYLDSLGWVYYRQDKLELAERYLLRSLEKVKTDPIVHSHLGDVYFKLGKTEKARLHWERSLEEWERSAQADRDPNEIAKVRKKLAALKVGLSKAQAESRE